MNGASHVCCERREIVTCSDGLVLSRKDSPIGAVQSTSGAKKEK